MLSQEKSPKGWETNMVAFDGTQCKKYKIMLDKSSDKERGGDKGTYQEQDVFLFDIVQ